jgi:hypothetical protein
MHPDACEMNAGLPAMTEFDVDYSLPAKFRAGLC